MLLEVYSDLPSFKKVTFHKGLNLILAEKGSQSTDGHTRNGAGKSSLVEIINALLGSDLRKGNILKAPEIVDNTFGIKISLAGKQVHIERSGASSTKLRIRQMPKGFLPVTLYDGENYITNDQWLECLGRELFNISGSMKAMKNGVSFRSLSAYFARPSKGFDSPEKTFPLQAAWQVQVALTYLLKLNWKIAREFEGVRQKDKLIKALKKASNEGTLGAIMGSASELSTEIHLKEDKAARLQRLVSEFRVLPEYQDKETRIAQISKRLSELSAEDTVDKEWQSQLERTIDDEIEPDNSKLERLFSEVQIELPDLITRRFDEFEAFHESIVKNRRDHLKQEMDVISTRIELRFSEKQALDNERAQILSLLQEYGALEQYMSLQSELSALNANVELLKQKLAATQNLDDQKIELKIERHNLQRKMRIDHSERDEAIRQAVVYFAEISKQLYEEPGKFTIDPTENGPKFEFDIPGKKSTGKSKMQIFCFDMMLMKLWAEEPNRPEVLIHDSLMFDGVDERQIAKALMVGAQMSEQYNFQYIVTMNSDDIPDMSGYNGFNVENYRVDLNITDSEAGGLFGIRF